MREWAATVLCTLARGFLSRCLRRRAMRLLSTLSAAVDAADADATSAALARLVFVGGAAAGAGAGGGSGGDGQKGVAPRDRWSVAQRGRLPGMARREEAARARAAVRVLEEGSRRRKALVKAVEARDVDGLKAALAALVDPAPSAALLAACGSPEEAAEAAVKCVAALSSAPDVKVRPPAAH